MGEKEWERQKSERERERDKHEAIEVMPRQTASLVSLDKSNG